MIYILIFFSRTASLQVSEPDRAGESFIFKHKEGEAVFYHFYFPVQKACKISTSVQMQIIYMWEQAEIWHSQADDIYPSTFTCCLINTCRHLWFWKASFTTCWMFEAELLFLKKLFLRLTDSDDNLKNKSSKNPHPPVCAGCVTHLKMA